MLDKVRVAGWSRLPATMRRAVAAAAAALTLSASAQDDHGDEAASASLLPIGGTVPGRLGTRSDTDAFRLDVVGRALVEIRTSGQTDTEGELLDGTGARLMSDDDSGAGDNFRLESDLAPGVYYVQVSGAVGEYAVNARLGGSRDHGDTIGTSTLLKLHTVEELSAVAPQVLLATAGRIWPSADDRDVFRIDVGEASTRVRVRTSGSVDTYGRLMDASEAEIAFADGGDGNFSIERTLDAGIYYVEVHGHDTGAYRILGQIVAGTGSTDPVDDPDGGSAPDAPDVTALGPDRFRVSWEWDYRIPQSSVFQVQIRPRGGDWRTHCAEFRSVASGRYTYRLNVSGANPDTTYDARYRYRPDYGCEFGRAGPWSGIGSATTPGDDGGSASGFCRDDDDIAPSGDCGIYDTNVTFDVSASGTGCLRSSPGFTACAGRSLNWRNSTINGETFTFVAERNSDDSWTIEDVEPEPPGNSAATYSKSHEWRLR